MGPKSRAKGQHQPHQVKRLCHLLSLHARRRSVASHLLDPSSEDFCTHTRRKQEKAVVRCNGSCGVHSCSRAEVYKGKTAWDLEKVPTYGSTIVNTCMRFEKTWQRKSTAWKHSLISCYCVTCRLHCDRFPMAVNTELWRNEMV